MLHPAAQRPAAPARCCLLHHWDALGWRLPYRVHAHQSQSSWCLAHMRRKTIGRAAVPSAAAASRRRAAARRRYVLLLAPPSDCTSQSSSQKTSRAAPAVAAATPPQPPSHRRRACMGSHRACAQHPAHSLCSMLPPSANIPPPPMPFLPVSPTCATAIRWVRLRRLSHACAWHRWLTSSPCRRRSAPVCSSPAAPLPAGGRHCSASSRHAAFSAAAAAGRQGSGSAAHPGSPRRCAAKWLACSAACQSARHVALGCGGQGDSQGVKGALALHITHTTALGFAVSSWQLGKVGRLLPPRTCVRSRCAWRSARCLSRKPSPRKRLPQWRQRHRPSASSSLAASCSRYLQGGTHLRCASKRRQGHAQRKGDGGPLACSVACGRLAHLSGTASGQLVDHTASVASNLHPGNKICGWLQHVVSPRR